MSQGSRQVALTHSGAGAISRAICAHPDFVLRLLVRQTCRLVLLFIFDGSSNKVGIVFTPVQRKKLKVGRPGLRGR